MPKSPEPGQTGPSPAPIENDPRRALRDAIGFLNFSSGKHDPRFAAQLDLLAANSDDRSPTPTWRRLEGLLKRDAVAARLDAEAGHALAFRQVRQAERVLELAFDRLLPAYRAHHVDLLGFQPDDDLFNSFFVARACEAVLRQGPPWDETDSIVARALAELNDYVGLRPLAVLQNERKSETYPHERVALVPLYLRGAGAASGKRQAIVERAVQILHETDPSLRERAWFELDCLEELAYDPRAYDFDHPANKRPNYQFGTWDFDRLDTRGNFCRFVIQQVTLDGLLSRTTAPSDVPVGASPVSESLVSELLVEAATVLAGAILMASAVTGSRPDTHDSSVTLGTLLPIIARLRDDFYQHWIVRLPQPHAARLKEEAKRLRQPFAGARHHLNQALSRLRATQLQHVELSMLFARMRRPDASSRQAERVSTASARMTAEIQSLIVTGLGAAERGECSHGAALWDQARDLVERAIQCGALPDPWNILGFQGQFPLFPAVENSVQDHRIDVLIDLLRQLTTLGARLQAEAALHGDDATVSAMSLRLDAFARWWDRFASTEVSSVEGFSGREAAESSRRVADALIAMRRAGAGAGDVAFWREHAADFHSSKAYALVVDSLIDRREFAASMGLMMQWLNQADSAPLDDGSHSFYDLAAQWMRRLYLGTADSPAAARANPAGDRLSPEECWKFTRRWFDFLEANANEYWQVPEFELGAGANHDGSVGSEDSEFTDEAPDEEDDPLYGAAYEGMSYRDSTRDGIESDMLSDGPSLASNEIEGEFDRIVDRLHFLSVLGRLWRSAAVSSSAPEFRSLRGDAPGNWRRQALENCERLSELLDAIHAFPLPRPGGSQESLQEYDRQHHFKLALLNKATSTCVETSLAARMLAASETEPDAPLDESDAASVIERMLAAMVRGDATLARRLFPALLATIADQPLLYVGFERDGDPKTIVAAQTLKHTLLYLLRGLPALGLLEETCRLLAAAHELERTRPAGAGAITEFDRLFDACFQALVERLVAVSAGRSADADRELVEALEGMTEFLSRRWIEHSRSIRLAAVERIADDAQWRRLVAFIERYGHDLFSPMLFNIGRLRAILHQGVDEWLDNLLRDPPDEPIALVVALEAGGAEAKKLRRDAVAHLTLVFEAIVDNFMEYRDYATTTTLSDRGERLYALLDFLRIKAQYERFQWMIRPAATAHEILVRSNRHAAAELWRRSIAQRTSDAADWHLSRLEELAKTYGVRLATVADRLAERFVQPLAIDRLKALAGPAIAEARRGGPSPSFDAFERDLREFTDRPTGAGLDAPPWLEQLTDEVEIIQSGTAWLIDDDRDFVSWLPQAPLTWSEVRRQLAAAEAREDERTAPEEPE